MAATEEGEWQVQAAKENAAWDAHQRTVEKARAASPNAAAELLEALAGHSSLDEMDDYQRATDCPDGCSTDPDGTCEHGYESAALTLGVV